MEDRIRLAMHEFNWRLVAHNLTPGNLTLHLMAASNHASSITYWRATFSTFRYTNDITILVPDFFEHELNKQIQARQH